MLELVWRESQVTIVSQTTSTNKLPLSQPSLPPLPPPPSNPPLYIAEDEMASWLHYPFEDVYTDLLYPNPNDPSSSTQPPPPHPPPSPPAPPPRQMVIARSFQPFSRVASRLPEKSISPADITVVGSNDSPATAVGGGGGSGGVGLRSGGGSGSVAYTSSSSATGSEMAPSTTEAITATTVSIEDDVKKGQESGGVVSTTNGGPSEDTDLDVAAKKLKHPEGSTSRRSRAAEVHNLSERKRRDRINEKMKQLQDLVPHSNKSDKASMLDDAIEYLKSLQLQVQMMSMGCGMVPMMYPEMQPRYVHPSGMIQAATSPQLASSVVPPATVYPMCALPAPGFSVMRPNTLPNTTNSLIPYQSPGIPQYPNVANPYQQYMAQNPSPSQPDSSKTNTSVTGKEHDDKKDG